MNIALLVEIAMELANLGRNPVFKHKADEAALIFSLGGFALQQFGMADADRKILLMQIKEANAAGRGLTDDQTQNWHDQHDAMKKAINDYFADKRKKSSGESG